MAETPRGWQLLHSKLPAHAIKELAQSVYGVSGLSDINEGFLIQRLFASGMSWNWVIVKQEYLGFEDKTSQGGKDYRVYMAAVHGRLQILDTNGERIFDGSGASDNRKLDAAYKGAATVAFKNACKLAGLTAQLYLDGRAIDHIYSERVRKDEEMVPESRAVETLLAQAVETFGDPSQKASEQPMALPPVTIPAAVDAAPKTNGADRSSSESEDRQPLYVLARSLKIPRTALEVDQKIDKQSFNAVLRELILAHGRDCGTNACEHVVQLAGLK